MDQTMTTETRVWGRGRVSHATNAARAAASTRMVAREPGQGLVWTANAHRTGAATAIATRAQKMAYRILTSRPPANALPDAAFAIFVTISRRSRQAHFVIDGAGPDPAEMDRFSAGDRRPWSMPMTWPPQAGVPRHQARAVSPATPTLSPRLKSSPGYQPATAPR